MEFQSFEHQALHYAQISLDLESFLAIIIIVKNIKALWVVLSSSNVTLKFAFKFWTWKFGK